MIKKIIIQNVYSYYGGPVVLSTLCKTLRDMGYDARVYMTFDFVKYKTSCFGRLKYIVLQLFFLVTVYLKYELIRIFPNSKFTKNKRFDILRKYFMDLDYIKIQFNPFFNRKTSIVVYPEIVYGNPLKAKNVVRWLLYYYKFAEDKQAYNETDMFISYREIFNDSDLNPTNKIVTLNYFDKKMYRQYNYGERNGNCYIIRKGKDRSDLPKVFDGPVYNDDMTQEDLVKMFNEYKFCYSYDTQTFYSSIASICGCISIVVIEPGKTEKDYCKEEEYHYGVAYGNTQEQIQYALETRGKLMKSLDFDEMNKKNAQKFVYYIEQYFGELNMFDNIKKI